MQALWSTVIVPLLWLIASLASVVAIVAIIKGFYWLMERLDNLD